MTTTVRTRFARLALPTLAAAAVLGGFATPAHAVVTDAPVTTTFVKYGSGVNRVVPDSDGDRRSAGSKILKLSDGTEIEAFCIEFEKLVSEQATYNATRWADAGETPEVLGRAAYIAENHAAIGTKYSDVSWENAATQVAIWELTDGIDADTLGNTGFAQRVNDLVAASAGKAETEPVVDFKLEGSKSVKGEGASSVEVIAGKVTDAAGAAVVGADVKFTVDGADQSVKTDDNGVARIELPRAAAARDVAMLVQVNVEAGTVFKPTTEHQAMISADDFTVARQANLQVAAFTPPVEDPAPQPEPAPAPEEEKPQTTPEKSPEPKVEEKPKPPVVETTPVADVPEQLPHTGGMGLVGLVAGALGLTGAGVAGRQLVRRR